MKQRSNGSYSNNPSPASAGPSRRPANHLAARAPARAYPIQDAWDDAAYEEDPAYAPDENWQTWEQRSSVVDSGWVEDSEYPDDETYGYGDDGYEYDERADAYPSEPAYAYDYPPDYAYETAQPFYNPLSNGPTPRLIAFVTLFVCTLLAGGLMSVTGGATLALNLASAAAAQPALDEIEAPPAPAPAAEPVAQAAPPPTGECAVSDLFPQKVRRWCDLITAHANQHALAPDLVAALIWLESGGDELAYSRSGAVGLMQVMPSDGPSANFMCINGPCFSDRPTIAQLQDPAFNVKYGTRMLAGLLKRSGNLREALKSYGPMDVGYSYADQVLSIFQRNTK